MKTIIQLCLLSTFALSIPAIAEPEVKQAEALVFNCYTCHSTSIGDNVEGIPTLTGLTAKAIEDKLLRYRLDQSQATIMNRIAKGYSEEEIRAIADYLAKVK